MTSVLCAARILCRALLLCALLALIPAARALASTTQQSMIEDDGRLLGDPYGTMEQFRLLGAQSVRVAFRWQLIAPKPNSHKRPHGFKNPSNPASYPAKSWRAFDEIVEAAKADGMSLNFDLTGGAPLWDTGRGAPTVKGFYYWEPSDRGFQQFVTAVGTRYSGNYNPGTNRLDPGNPNDLPAVRFWSVWNEPDYGPSLAPQGVPGHLTIPNSPRLYRGLVNAAWKGLHASGHGSDQVLIGEVAPRGAATWGVFSGMKPLIFIRNLYCVSSSYHMLSGGTASSEGCPTHGGAAGFRAQNPALFAASGFSDHPYMRWYQPDQEKPNDPNYTSLADVGQLTRALDRIQHTYGSSKQFPIWDTEFGYITSPPQVRTKYPWALQSTAAYYDNWAEYISYKNPRIVSFHQYLLYDPQKSSKDSGGFASGLINYTGKPKPGYDAWRLPLYLPVTSASAGSNLEVWGAARPAPYALRDTGQPQSVEIQFAPSSGSFSTLQTVPVTSPEGYIDVRVVFPASGTVRLAYTYPTGDPLLIDGGQTVYSRSVAVKVG